MKKTPSLVRHKFQIISGKMRLIAHIFFTDKTQKHPLQFCVKESFGGFTHFPKSAYYSIVFFCVWIGLELPHSSHYTHLKAKRFVLKYVKIIEFNWKFQFF